MSDPQPDVQNAGIRPSIEMEEAHVIDGQEIWIHSEIAAETEEEWEFWHNLVEKWNRAEGGECG